MLDPFFIDPLYTVYGTYYRVKHDSVLRNSTRGTLSASLVSHQRNPSCGDSLQPLAMKNRDTSCARLSVPKLMRFNSQESDCGGLTNRSCRASDEMVKHELLSTGI